jgi:hypothetical protein
MKTDKALDRFEAEVLAAIPVEKRLRGVPTEERLRGVPTEERLRGVPAEEIVRALLADERCRDLSRDQLAILQNLLARVRHPTGTKKRPKSR